MHYTQQSIYLCSVPISDELKVTCTFHVNEVRSVTPWLGQDKIKFETRTLWQLNIHDTQEMQYLQIYLSAMEPNRHLLFFIIGITNNFWYVYIFWENGYVSTCLKPWVPKVKQWNWPLRMNNKWFVTSLGRTDCSIRQQIEYSMSKIFH